MKFGFGGALDNVLRRHFLRDAEQAVLSRKFIWYYRIRPWIPTPIRQLLQLRRNSRMDRAPDWFIPSAFLRDWRTAIDSDILADGERTIIHPWPDGFRFASVLTHDVETKAGQRLVADLADLEEEKGFRSAWNFVPYKYTIDDGLVRDLAQRGFEIGIHGYNHDGRLFASKATFRKRVYWINAALDKYDCLGFRAPMVHRNLKWLQSLEVEYDASCFDVDPFQAMPGGVGGIWPFFAGRFVELPYTLPQDHTLLISLGEKSIRIWKQKLDFLQEWSGMAMLVTHPDYLNTPAILNVYCEFLDHLRELPNQWKALPRDVAKWWRQRDASRINTNLQIEGAAENRGRVISIQQLFGDNNAARETTTGDNYVTNDIDVSHERTRATGQGDSF